MLKEKYGSSPISLPAKTAPFSRIFLAFPISSSASSEVGVIFKPGNCFFNSSGSRNNEAK